MVARYHGIDALRGLALVNMVIYHLLYDINTVYGLQVEWINQPMVRFWQQNICWSFIIIAGFSWQWGQRHNVRRGLKLNLYGFLISLVTMIILPNHAIWFGILNFLGCAVLLHILVAPLTNRISPLVGLILALILHFILRDIQLGVIGPGWDLPNVLYATCLGAPLGLPPVYFASTDYFPILPWYPVFLCGVFLYRIFLQCPRCQRLAAVRVPLLSWMGRHSIAIYLIHQPLCFIACYLFMGMP